MSNEYEKVALKCQKYLANIPTIVIGSGFSIPYGLPSMNSLGKKIKEKLDSIYKGEKEWDDFIRILDTEQNLEMALQKANLLPNMHTDIITVTWKHINNKDNLIYNSIVKEYVDMPLSRMFSKLLESHSKTVNVITSNYDRLIEYAADLSGAIVDTGFYGEYIKRMSSSSYSNIGKGKKVVLCKVHGSLDWFKKEFDQQAISVTNTKKIANGLIPLIVAPGVEKYRETHLDPYRTLITKADKLISDAPCYLCIGYGFNDEHLQPKIIQNIQTANKPIVIVTYKLSDKGKEILKNSKKYIVFEQNDNETTKVTIDDNESILDGSLWELRNFAKMWLGNDI